jgi:DNA-binding transcriptional LysR family regulator
VAALRENRADIGIFAERTQTEGVAVFEYRRDQLVLITPRDHPLAQRKSLSLADATSLADRLHAESSRLEKPLRPRIHVRSFDACAAWCAPAWASACCHSWPRSHM